MQLISTIECGKKSRTPEIFVSIFFSEKHSNTSKLNFSLPSKPTFCPTKPKNIYIFLRIAAQRFIKKTRKMQKSQLTQESRIKSAR